jgi:hypothetical protein
MTSETIEHRRSGKDAMQVEFRLDPSEGTGTFEGYLSLWDKVDSYQTRFIKRAYSRGGLEVAYALQDMHSLDSYTRDTLGMFKAIEDERG